MSELIENARQRREILKHMIRQLHDGQAPEQVKTQLARMLGRVPYEEVVAVEQELIAEGLPMEEIQALCDIHHRALEGAIDTSQAPAVPPGHPAHTFTRENEALGGILQELEKAAAEVEALPPEADATEPMTVVRGRFNDLRDVEKHYLRKENLLFPFLEKHGITGPSQVMWGKHDEARKLLKSADEALAAATVWKGADAQGILRLLVRPAARAVSEMILKEEQILLPMSRDTLTEGEWAEVHRQSPEIGFCLVDPSEEWHPAPEAGSAASNPGSGRVVLPSGSFSAEELTVVLNTIPFDMTFVDRDDRVRYFSQGRERIFSRNRAILGRRVQNCHPPHSVKTVERILEDFKSGRESRAAFWITMKGRFIHIEYFALRGADGGYLGCLEVSQDLTEKRTLTGEQRLLNYGGNGKVHHDGPSRPRQD